ncbi:MAG: hypothetical protein FWD05_09635 [Oscillospiraceae bacterium]|nr:hypothetical protein [Oscillospiraceae bacterium]
MLEYNADYPEGSRLNIISNTVEAIATNDRILRQIQFENYTVPPLKLLSSVPKEPSIFMEVSDLRAKQKASVIAKEKEMSEMLEELHNDPLFTDSEKKAIIENVAQGLMYLYSCAREADEMLLMGMAKHMNKMNIKI